MSPYQTYFSLSLDELLDLLHGATIFNNFILNQIISKYEYIKMMFIYNF